MKDSTRVVEMDAWNTSSDEPGEKHASGLTRQPVFQLWRWRHVHSTLAVTVKEGGVGAMAQQQGTHLHPVLRRSLVERRELPEVHGVHTGTVLQSEKPN